MGVRILTIIFFFFDILYSEMEALQNNNFIKKTVAKKKRILKLTWTQSSKHIDSVAGARKKMQELPKKLEGGDLDSLLWKNRLIWVYFAGYKTNYKDGDQTLCSLVIRNYNLDHCSSLSINKLFISSSGVLQGTLRVLTS